MRRRANRKTSRATTVSEATSYPPRKPLGERVVSTVKLGPDAYPRRRRDSVFERRRSDENRREIDRALTTPKITGERNESNAYQQRKRSKMEVKPKR